MVVNYLGLTLTKEDLQDVVALMEPYGQINNGIELLSPPLDVSYCVYHFTSIIAKWLHMLARRVSKQSLIFSTHSLVPKNSPFIDLRYYVELEIFR